MSLDQQTAIQRAKIIAKNSIFYNFVLKIAPNDYEGLAEITFFINNLNFERLSLDFTGKEVTSMIINSIQVDGQRQQNYLYLPKECLQRGKNRVSIMYRNGYDIDGQGLVSFTDNQQQFLYTVFQPYAANRVFPCFDQPDLKAKMKLSVICDQNLRVLSTENIEVSQKYERSRFLKGVEWNHRQSQHLLTKFCQKWTSEQLKYSSFPYTKLISTYLYSLAVGNYKEIKPSAGMATTVQMSHFVLPSREKNFRRFSDFIFDVTIQCMKWFEKYFQHVYPFSKYDQLWIRQFSSYAMENVGLVVFDEQKMIPQEKATEYDMYIIASVVSHELSHHWFGNYVTMEWWDDLWLNESFAEFISCFSLEKVKNELSYKFESPFSYFRHAKNSGYLEDERDNATHPIRGVVENTDVAVSIFDGITYEKGAAVLKQLFYYVGQANMSNILKSYMDRFSYSNATINDLLDNIKPYFTDPKLTIESWRNSWLQTPSVNIFQCIWEAQNKTQNAELMIKQEAISGFHNHLRFHKIKVGLFDINGVVTLLDNIIIDDSGITKVAYDGTKNIAAILVNYDDETFAETIIDKQSLIYFMDNIQKIQDLYTRTIIWFNISSMVRLSSLNLSDFTELVINKLFNESSNLFFEKILQALLTYIHQYFSQNVRMQKSALIFNRIYSQLQVLTNADSDRSILLQKYYIKFALSESSVGKNLVDWLYKRDQSISQLALKNDNMWRIVVKTYELTSITIDKKRQIFNYAKIIDNSSASEDAGIVCEAIVANEDQLQTIYAELQSLELGYRTKSLKAEGWRSKFNYQFKFNKYKDKVFEDIDRLSTILPYDQLEFFYQHAVLEDSNISTQVNRYRTAIAKLKQKPIMLDEHVKNLNKVIDDLVLKASNITANIGTNNCLTQMRAIDRFQYIQPSSLRYNYHITYIKGSNYYEGLAQITFYLKQIPSVLPLDFQSNQVYSLIVNARSHKSTINGTFILISSAYLQVGANLINVWYRNAYNNDGIGCMSFTQTVSNPFSQYTYTHFQPYGCHRYVPCFDQPDLKTPVMFTIIVPDGWQVIGNEMSVYAGAFNIQEYKKKCPIANLQLLQQYLNNKSGTYFSLKQTQPIPTYLYCMVAGEYYKIPLDKSKQIRDIPMNLYCIKSYKDNINLIRDFIFQILLLSLAYYQDKFRVPYKFSKYDSVFCHEYKIGAMESPGVVTFNDNALYPQRVSVEKMLQLGNTIAHECSHNWFGNYVTMKWWDDLWLKESFADFISYKCLEEIKEKVTTISYDSGWKLHLVRVVNGYRQDQITPTTHGIRSDIENTTLAETAFDSITYQKGSATMKQLMFLMGQENFFKGLKDYFDAFGWKNGTIDDFLGSMQTYFTLPDFTLDQWKTSWLITPSPNVIQVEWNPTDLTQNAILKIKQTAFAKEYPQLRYHKTRIAFFKADATYDIVDILLEPKEQTSYKYDGSLQYTAVLVNVDYWAYFKYRIDKISLDFFKLNLNKIDNVLTRTIIWHDINEAVRDSKLKVSDYIYIFDNFIYTETDDKIFQFQYNFIRDALNNYIPIPLRPQFKSVVFQNTYNELKKAQMKNTYQNRIVLLKDQLTYFASTNEQVNNLQLWRQNANTDFPDLPELLITVTQAWQVVKLVFFSDQYTPEAKNQTYLDQYNSTPGIKGQLTKNTCDMIIADAVQLQEAYNSFKKMILSIDSKRSYAEGWNSGIHGEVLLTNYKARYFGDLVDLSTKLSALHFTFFYTSLKPIDDNLQQTVNAYKDIKLQGEDMLGNIKLIAQITFMFELRLKLYDQNKVNNPAMHYR